MLRTARGVADQKLPLALPQRVVPRPDAGAVLVAAVARVAAGLAAVVRVELHQKLRPRLGLVQADDLRPERHAVERPAERGHVAVQKIHAVTAGPVPTIISLFKRS